MRIQTLYTLFTVGILVCSWYLGNSMTLAQTDERGTIWAVDWSPDGTRIATGDSYEFLTIWNAADLSILTEISVRLEGSRVGLQFNIHTIDWSPDNSLIAAGITTGDLCGLVQIIDVASQRTVFSIGVSERVTSIAWNPDGSQFAAGGSGWSGGKPEGWIKVWDAADYQMVADLRQGDADMITAMAWSPDGTRLASAALDETMRDNNVVIWDTTTWEPTRTLEHPDFVSAVNWSPDGTQIVTAGIKVRGRVWDTATGQVVVDLQLPPDLQNEIGGTSYLAWNANADSIVGLASHNILTWDPVMGELIGRQYTAIFSSDFAWCPDYTCIAYSSGSLVRIKPVPGNHTD